MRKLKLRDRNNIRFYYIFLKTKTNICFVIYSKELKFVKIAITQVRFLILKGYKKSFKVVINDDTEIGWKIDVNTIFD